MCAPVKPENPTQSLPIPPSNHSDTALISRATWLGRVVEQAGPKVTLASAVGGTISISGLLTASVAGISQNYEAFYAGITVAGLGTAILVTVMSVNVIRLLGHQSERTLPV